MDLNEVSEIISTARSYTQLLNSLNNEIEKAEKQILTTFDETKRNIETTFGDLRVALLNTLKNRENNLLLEAEQIRNEGITPLRQCKNVIGTKIQNTENLIKLGDNLNGSNFNTFNSGASLLGSLPEVPKLKEVPFITFNIEPNKEVELRELCSNFGQVFKTAPVQISNIHEKPGGLLVEWNTLETDDDLTYWLQKAFGDVSKEDHFYDCYRGPENQFLVKDLKINQAYTFRVCCSLGSTSLCVPWSVPQVAVTNLKGFSWEKDENFVLSNENKIASPLGDLPVVIYSDESQLFVGNSIEFTVLELNESECILGLTLEKDKNIEDLRKIKAQSFLLDKNGNIYIDGAEKATKLPQFSKKLTISFRCEFVNNEKIRVSVDSNDKQVTYDWMINPAVKLYFACQFFSSKWKIMVE